MNWLKRLYRRLPWIRKKIIAKHVKLYQNASLAYLRNMQAFESVKNMKFENEEKSP